MKQVDKNVIQKNTVHLYNSIITKQKNLIYEKTNVIFAQSIYLNVVKSRWRWYVCKTIAYQLIPKNKYFIIGDKFW